MMETTLRMFLIVCPLVFLAGLVDSIAGGGGLISLPAYLIAGVPPHLALGTNKMSSSIGTAVSTLRYCRHMPMRAKAAALAVACALAGSAAGSRLALLVDEQMLQSMLVVVLPIVAFVVLSNKKPLHDTMRPPLSENVLTVAMALISLIVGAYDGFYGPGTGTFLILLFMGVCRMEVREACAYTKIVNLSSNVAALTVFLINGKVVALLGLTAAAFSIAGHYIGAEIVLKRGYRAVRPVILIVLALLFAKLITG